MEKDMKTMWKNISTYVIMACVSVGATWATYSYLDSRAGVIDHSADIYTYGEKFNQEDARLTRVNGVSSLPDFTKAAEKSLHAVVHIKATSRVQQQASNSRSPMMSPFDFFFGFGGSEQYTQPQPQVGYGSGVIISNDGYIITNNHVINGATEIEVTLNDNRKFTAKQIGTDPVTDIALIKIEGKTFPYIPFGNSDQLRVGEWVLAVGNPFNLNSTVTAGIVSAKGRGGLGLGNGSTQSIQSFIQTDAAINPGNSGGALVNVDGQLVGINTAIYSQTGNFAGYGFAVPISIAGKVASDLKEFGAVQRAVLGVQIVDVVTAKEFANSDNAQAAKEFAAAKDLKIDNGAFVSGFAERSPAKAAGIEEGDVITSINGVPAKSVSELQDQVSRFRPGDKVKVGIVRGNSNKTITVELKNNDGNTSLVKKIDGMAVIGAAFKGLSNEEKRSYGISSGVVVTGVDNNGKFQKEGIRKGFVILKINNQPVSSSDDVEQIVLSVSKSQEKGLFLAGFYPADKRMRYYAIDLSEQ